MLEGVGLGLAGTILLNGVFQPGKAAVTARPDPAKPSRSLSRWFRARVGAAKGRVRRIAIVALARKLLVALWRYVTQGVVPEGAVFKAA